MTVEVPWRLLSAGFRLAEGPTLRDDGTLLVSDALGGGLRQLDLDGNELAPRLLEDRKGIGGVVLGARQEVIVSGREVVAVRGEHTECVLDRADGIAGYNDMAATPDGGLLAGALHFSPFHGEAPVPGSLRYRAPGGQVRVWHHGIVWPNGIGFSPDGGLVYAADYADGTVYRGAWTPDGPGELAAWASSPSGHADGLAVAADGSVLVATGAGGSVAWYAPDGELRGLAEVPAGFVSSVCFAGDELDQLVVTTLDNTLRPEQGGAVFIGPAFVAGKPVPRARL